MSDTTLSTPGHAVEDAHPGLDIDQNMTAQRREWTIERAGWGAIWLVLAAALAGFFGGGVGPVARGRAGGVGDTACRVEWDRFGHVDGVCEVRVFIPPGVLPAGEARVGVTCGYLRDVRIESIEPTPLREESGGEGSVYVFALEPGRERTGPLQVVFRLRPERCGLLRGWVEAGGGRAGGTGGGGGGEGGEPERVAFAQFVYP